MSESPRTPSFPEDDDQTRIDASPPHLRAEVSEDAPTVDNGRRLSYGEARAEVEAREAEARALLAAAPPSQPTEILAAPSARSRPTRLLVFAAGIGLVVGGGLFVVRARSETITALMHEPRALGAAPTTRDELVPTARVRQAPRERLTRFFGTTRATARAALAFPFGGRLLERPISVGDTVQAGDVLARIDATAHSAAAASAHATAREIGAQLELAESDRARVAQLRERGTISTQEEERAAARAASLRASREAASARASASAHAANDGTLRAPFDGTVSAVNAQVGEIVAAGAPVAIVSGDTGVEVELQLPETAMSDLLAVGLEVDVSFPVLDDETGVRGRITNVSRSAVGGFFPVIVLLDSAERVAAGLSAEVALPVPVRASLAVPVEAIVDPSGRQPRVIAVRAGRAQVVPVVVRELVDGWVTVSGDLQPTDEVVVGRHAFLLPGDPVRTIGSPNGR